MRNNFTLLPPHVLRIPQLFLRQTNGNAVAYKRVDLKYDEADQYETISRYASAGTDDLVASTSFAYDLEQRLEEMQHSDGAATLARHNWTHAPVRQATPEARLRIYA